MVKIIENSELITIFDIIDGKDKKGLFKYMESGNNENLQYDNNALNKLIDLNYPSIRNCINYLQNLKIQNKDCKIENIKKIEDDFEYIFNLIKNKKFTEIKKYKL